MIEIKKISFLNTESKEIPKYLKTSVNPSFHVSLEEAKKFQKKYYPEKNVGVSYESPTYFQTKHTLLNDKSYKNPFLSNPEEYGAGRVSEDRKEKRQKISDTQSFRIGENSKRVSFSKVKLPSVEVYESLFFF
jgi:hypothetical protein